MFYAVSIREKGKSNALESSVCTQDEVQQWCQHAKSIAQERGVIVLAEFKPREQIFEFDPTNPSGQGDV